MTLCPRLMGPVRKANGRFVHLLSDQVLLIVEYQALMLWANPLNLVGSLGSCEDR